MVSKNFNKNLIILIGMSLIFILVGSIMLYFGITKCIEENNQLESKYSITKGIVTNTRTERKAYGGEYTYFSYITIDYTVENKQYTIEQSPKKNVPNIKSILKLKYDKTNPEKASIYKSTIEDNIYEFLIVLGYMFTVFPLIMIFAQFYYKMTNFLISLSFLGFSYVLFKFFTVNVFDFSFINILNVVGIVIFVPLFFAIIGMCSIIKMFVNFSKKQSSEN